MWNCCIAYTQDCTPYLEYNFCSYSFEMSGKTILLTGGTGHVGFATLVEALSKGYKVRAAVRSNAKAEVIRSAKSVQPYLSKLEFVIVKDITQAGAFNEAIKGVDAVVHLASPIVGANVKDAEEDLYKPAVQGTTGILHSAKQEASVKRVVITSSVAAVVPLPPSQERYTADSVGPISDGPFPDLFMAYVQSKARAHNAVLRFIEEQKPQFNVISIMPTFVIGANELAKTPEEINVGSNAYFLLPILGGKNDEGTFTSLVHLDDVAFVHIAALDPKLEGTRNFGVNYDYTSGFKWDDALKIAQEEFPEAVKAGILPLNGHLGDIVSNFDCSETERVFGFKFKSPREMTKSIVGQYVAAVQEQKA